jgi:hypothetical protein
LLTQIVSSFAKLLRRRVVLEEENPPDDTRILHLFRNRAELKKSYADAQDEIHRLKDRVKLQEAATARVREQMEGLEARLSVPVSGMHSLLHYQLRDLWKTGHTLIGSLVRELAQQFEDRERRQFTAELNRKVFERQQSARQAVAQAEHVSVDVRSKLSAVQTALKAASSWWEYFRRRDLHRRLSAMQIETRLAEEILAEAREQLRQIDEDGGARFPGLSIESRRVLNVTAIACANILAMRLMPVALLARAADAMARSEPRVDGQSDLPACVTTMQEVARAKVAMQGNAATAADARRLSGRMLTTVSYRSAAATVPTEDSVLASLRGCLAKPELMTWDVLREDLWSVSDVFYLPVEP